MDMSTATLLVSLPAVKPITFADHTTRAVLIKCSQMEVSVLAQKPQMFPKAMKRGFRSVAIQDTRPCSSTRHPPDPLWVITSISLVGMGNDEKKKRRRKQNIKYQGSLPILRALVLFSYMGPSTRVHGVTEPVCTCVCRSMVHRLLLSLPALFQLFCTQGGTGTGADHVRNSGDWPYISPAWVLNLFLRKCLLRRKQKTLERKQILNRK